MARTRKGRFLLDPPPGFVGFDRFGDWRMYRRRLPHWRQDGATYFVTFRLADSLPASALRDIRTVRTDWETAHPEPRSDDDWRDYAEQVSIREENWLDRGHCSCCLRRVAHAEMVANALEAFDGKRYDLGAYVVMPNHVHVVVRPEPGAAELNSITRNRKGYTARCINAAESRVGQRCWQGESFDSIIRDGEHLYRVIRYIGRNPEKAGLRGRCPRWVRPDWAEAGYGFED